MTKQIIDYDRSGKLSTGQFFQLYIDPVSLDTQKYMPKEELPAGTVARWLDLDGPYVYAEGLYDREVARRCTLNPSHEVEVRESNRRADLFGGNSTSGFVSDSFGRMVIADRRLRDSLNGTDLNGFSTSRLEVSVNQSELQNPDLYLLDFLGKPCSRGFTITIPRPNECPFCRWGPIVCPECLTVERQCPHCKKKTVVSALECPNTTDVRFVVHGIKRGDRIIEGTRWDGSDFVAGEDQGYITGRALDVIASLDVKPFVAYPCCVDLTGCETEQLARIRKVTSVRYKNRQ